MLKVPERLLMTSSGTSTDNEQNDIKIRISLIKEIYASEFGSDQLRLDTLISDVTELYQGKWPSYQECQTGYHNIGHAIDVALLTARMIGGWNRYNDREHPRLSEDIFLDAIAGALFHDTGYIKESGDSDGRGGKYSFNHEERSMAMAGAYLSEHKWPPRTVDLVPIIISTTKFHVELQLKGLFNSPEEMVIGRMVATADLVAQMADVNYMERITDLYDELNEAYEFEGVDNLEKNGFKVFTSANEMIDGTVAFYEGFVVPRLDKLGKMDQYLVSFFGGSRNPYLENITANLSGQLIKQPTRWQRLGDVLENLGLASKEAIQAALNLQEKSRKPKTKETDKKTSIQDRLLAWMEGDLFDEKCVGEYLMDMEAISPELLRKGLLHQVMPSNVMEKLSREELVFLLEISMLLQSLGRGPWLFNQILEMTNELIKCEGSYILLSKTESQEMLMAIPTGPGKDTLDGQTFPADKGLAGWVFSHGRPAIVSNVKKDTRFNSVIDKEAFGKFEIKSILAVPLHINGELIGVMEVVNKEHGEFNEQDMNLLTLVANIIAVSIDSVFRIQEINC
jgi:putative methionine-R-sulfoxide reductase with GAF domain